MRVLWVTEHYAPSPGGMARSCERIVRGLRAAGLPVDVLHLSRRARRQLSRPEVNGTRLIAPLGDDSAHALQLAWLQVQAHAATAPPSHIVAFGGLLPLMAAPAFAAWLGCPLITLLRGNDWDLGLLSAQRQPLLAAAIERSAMVCTVTSQHQRQVQALFPKAAVTWVPNSVDPNDWESLPIHMQQASDWRAINASDGRLILGMFGHLKAKKGLEVLLAALAAPTIRERVVLYMVGTIDEAGAAALATHPELPVVHEPFASRLRLPACYRSCDIVALPSFYDGMPNVLLEAGCCELPILASATGGMADVLAGGSFGELFTPGDSAACRAALQRVLALPRHQLQKRGVALAGHIRAVYTPQREATAYLRCILGR